MSRYYDDYVEHSWGTDPKQKVKEKAYNAGEAVNKFGKNVLGIGARGRAEKSAEDLMDARLSNAYAYDDMQKKKQQYLKFKNSKDLESYKKSIKTKNDTQKKLNKAKKKAYRDYDIYDKSLAGKAGRAISEGAAAGRVASKAGKKAGKTVKKAGKNLSKYLNPEPTVTFGEPVVTGTNGVPTKKSKSKASKKKKK